MALARGDIVLIPYPYSDLSASKTRPAIVISSVAYHSVFQELLLAYLTSQVTNPHPDFDYLLVDWQEAGLLKPTLMKARVAVIKSSLVQHRVGQLSQRDMVAVDRCLRRAMAL
jgi:mRNA interferase MazF